MFLPILLVAKRKRKKAIRKTNKIKGKLKSIKGGGQYPPAIQSNGINPPPHVGFFFSVVL